MTYYKDKYKGLAGTIIFHLLLLALLLFLGFSTPLPLPGEEGVEVNLGNSEFGMGNIQPEQLPEVQPIADVSQQTEDVNEDIVTQDIEDAPAVEKKKETNTEDKVVKDPNEKESVKEEPQVNQAALYKGKSKNTNENSGEGITDKSGDQGKPTGTMDSDNYLGQGGFGDGPSYSLSGRIPKYLPLPSGSFRENGTVVVQITVDKYGKVIKATSIDKGSNTTSTSLRKLAEQAAKKAVFNANPDAAEMQRGSITYHFIVRN